MEYSSTNIAVICLLVTLVAMEIRLSMQQQCPIPIKSVSNYALTGSEFTSSTVQGYPDCVEACHRDTRCTSLNFDKTAKRCGLNSQTKDSKPGLFVPKYNNIYSTNGAYRKPGPIVPATNPPPSTLASNLSKSCLEILKRGTSRGSGIYTVDLGHKEGPFQIYCDMITDGGGWTIVKKLVLKSTQPPHKKDVKDFRIIQNFNDNSHNYIPLASGMRDLHNKMGYNQILFYCLKKSVGRVVSIVTKNNIAGQEVVRYFKDDGFAKDNYPTACGSFDRLPDDTSVLSQRCAEWGLDGNGMKNKWGKHPYNSKHRMGNIPIYITSNLISPDYGFGCDNNLYICDDSRTSPLPLTVGDTWIIAVR